MGVTGNAQGSYVVERMVLGGGFGHVQHCLTLGISGVPLIGLDFFDLSKVGIVGPRRSMVVIVLHFSKGKRTIP